MLWGNKIITNGTIMYRLTLQRSSHNLLTSSPMLTLTSRALRYTSGVDDGSYQRMMKILDCCSSSSDGDVPVTEQFIHGHFLKVRGSQDLLDIG